MENTNRQATDKLALNNLRLCSKKPSGNQSGSHWVWINAGSIALCIILVLGLIGLIAVKGLQHFWPADVLVGTYKAQMDGFTDEPTLVLAGELVDTKTTLTTQLQSAGFKLDDSKAGYERLLLKTGNRDINGADFVWVLADWFKDINYPKDISVVERMEWGNFYGFISAIDIQGLPSLDKGLDKTQINQLFLQLGKRFDEIKRVRKQIKRVEKHDIGDVNYKLEKRRLQAKRLAMNTSISTEKRALEQASIDQATLALGKQYEDLVSRLRLLRDSINQDSITLTSVSGIDKVISLNEVVRLYKPNAMSFWQKLRLYFSKLAEFITEDPREANTEGGIFPAIFGTVLMVMLMSLLVTPLGVIAAVYLHEYTKQGMMSRLVRIAVNNLAGVPSIVYGIFGLGFFIYFIGSNIDQAFYKEALPAPTFGTPGLLWAALTLAILTIPVVIVSTEEGLSRVPKAIREGGLALGATKAEVLWRLVIPMATPGIMTGVILAIARAAGEVAPLMLVGAVKLAPNLVFDTNAPYLHLDRKFMHLGFHIFDVGFQSPNVEASRPLVYATALMLILIIVILNLTAVSVRNHLREKYKLLES